MRALLVAKRSAREARIKAITQIRHLSFTAPDELRARLKALSCDTLAEQTASMRPRAQAGSVMFAHKLALSSLGGRVQALDDEIARIDDVLADLVANTAPSLLDIYGVGVDTAASLLVVVGDNPQRIRSEAAFANLCGVSPIEASSGKVTRHRLNRGGNRQANQALWRIVMTRMAFDPRTRDYVDRRTKEGRSKREIIRVLKRYVAREVYRHLIHS